MPTTPAIRISFCLIVGVDFNAAAGGQARVIHVPDCSCVWYPSIQMQQTWPDGAPRA